VNGNKVCRYRYHPSGTRHRVVVAVAARRSPINRTNDGSDAGNGTRVATSNVLGTSQPLQKLPPSVEKQFRRRATYAPAPPSVTSRTWLPPEMSPNHRSLNVAIVGEPNVGKSTLINRILKRKVSAVSAKYNTTRDRVLGVLTEGNVQLVFYDTPGFVPAGGVRIKRSCSLQQSRSSLVHLLFFRAHATSMSPHLSMPPARQQKRRMLSSSSSMLLDRGHPKLARHCGAWQCCA
jgi:hypothetical protein